MEIHNNGSNSISRTDVMMSNNIEFTDRTKVLSIFEASNTDNDKSTLTGEEVNNFVKNIAASFKDRAGEILNAFGLSAPKQAEAPEAAKTEEETNEGIPEKTPEGRLTPEQVEQYINNSPRCKKFRNYLENCTDFTRKSIIEQQLKSLPKVLENWVDTPKDEDGGIVRQGSVEFTHVKKETLPDGTKVYNTAQGYYNLWFNGLPGGDKMSEEELKQHGWVEE